jgi:hypothetical protein
VVPGLGQLLDDQDAGRVLEMDVLAECSHPPELWSHRMLNGPARVGHEAENPRE